MIVSLNQESSINSIIEKWLLKEKRGGRRTEDSLLRTHMSRKVGHLVLQEAVLVERRPGSLVHLCCHVFSRHAGFSSLHPSEQLRASLQRQLVQRHVVVAHLQQLRQLALPGFNALFGTSEHHVHRHPPGEQPPGLLDGLQRLMGAVVSAQDL